MFDLGTLRNPVLESATLALRYSAVVIDNPGNVRGRGLTNDVTWDWTGGRLIDNAPDVLVVEPTLTLEKSADPRSVPPGGVVTFTMTVDHPAPPSNSPAFDLVLTDTVPAGMTYVAGSLAASAGGAVDDTAAPALRVTWDVLDLNASVTATFQATMGSAAAGTRIRNDGFLELVDVARGCDIATVKLQSAFHGACVRPTNQRQRCRNHTGAAGDWFRRRSGDRSCRLDRRHPPTRDLGGLRLEIPQLDVRSSIVGVPSGAEQWDLTWLWDDVGHLEGTAYPTWSGNSALTAHVFRPDGMPGPFERLGELSWDDPIFITANGQRYEYRVREVQRVAPHDLSVLSHRSRPWLTLITCQGYDEPHDKYLWRLAVGAVLVDIQPAP